MRTRGSLAVAIVCLVLLLVAGAAALAQQKPAQAPAKQAKPAATAAPAGQAARPAPPPAAAQPDAEMQAKIEQYRNLGLDEKTATLMAAMDSGDDDSSMLPLMMLMMADNGGHGGGEAAGLLFMSMLSRSASASAPVAVTQGDNTLLVIDKGRVYKIDTSTMKVLGEVRYKKSGSSAAVQMLMSSVLSNARDKARQAECLSNMKQLCLAALMYTQDHNGHWPGANWVQELQPYIKNPRILVCPSRPETPVGYAMNKAFVGTQINQVQRPAQAILFFESKIGGASPVGTAADVPIEGVHNGGICVGYADGHCKWASVNEARQQLEQGQ